MFVYLGNQVGVIRRLISTGSKTKSFLLDKLIVVVRIVDATSRCRRILQKIDFFAISNWWFSGWQLAVVWVESNRTLRIAIFKSFWFGETKWYLCRRIVREMLLNILMRNYRYFAHVINFIMKKDKILNVKIMLIKLVWQSSALPWFLVN